MEASLDLWFEYILRFSHLVAGIAWIGSSFYFIWLDGSFLPPMTPRKNVEGEVFMVHGGFYYQVEKKKIFPGEIPDILHWFKWEATLTLLTGYVLLIYIYFFNNASLLIDPTKYEFTQWQATFCCVGLIAVSWIAYDGIWHPRVKFPSIAQLGLSLLLFSLVIYKAFDLFSGRGAFITIGVIFGTIMVLNVWVRILPGQSKMLKDAQAGKVPDYSQGLKSKVRSVHNTYFTFPVLFVMLSNHYPGVYNHDLNWLLFLILGVSGALVRHGMVTKGSKKIFFILGAIGLLALVMTTAKVESTSAGADSSIDYHSQIKPIIESRCLQCHSTNNTDDVFKVAKKGFIFESQEQVNASKEAIIKQVSLKVMPLANKTKMTEEERSLLLAYLQSLK